MSQTELNILLTRNDPDLIEEVHRIAPRCRTFAREDLDSDDGLLDRIDVLYGWGVHRLLAHAGRARWCQTVSAGAGWTQHPEIVNHPAVVTNVHIYDESIAEHLFGLLLVLVRRLDVAVRNQEAHEWKGPGEVGVLKGRTAVVVGCGSIGRRCGQLAAAFGMHVLGIRRAAKPAPHVEAVFGVDRLLDTLCRADVVFNLLPGTRETHHLLGAEALAALPRGALVLNAGRGTTLDTDALIEALRSGQVGGAGLDVTDPEPLPADHPLWDAPNVVITSHYSGSSIGNARRADEVFLENLRRFVADQPLINVVDKKWGY